MASQPITVFQSSHSFEPPTLKGAGYVPPTRKIYFYNVGPQEHVAKLPPQHPHFTIPACPKDQPWLMVDDTTVTHPYLATRYDANDRPFIAFDDGEREAAAMLNPDNPGIDPNFDDNGLSQNMNLNKFGVFWSYSYPPTAEEVAGARRRMEKTYRNALKLMDEIESKDPDGCRAAANNISHAAADYFGQSRSWHRTDLQPVDPGFEKVDCVVCGEKIRAKAMLCIHCGAPTDTEKQARWLEARFETKRGPGRPPNG